MLLQQGVNYPNQPYQQVNLVSCGSAARLMAGGRLALAFARRHFAPRFFSSMNRSARL